MAQFAAPIADITNQGYVTGLGSSTNLWAELDESVASTAQIIQSPLPPVNSVYVARLGPLVDPGVNTGHTLRWQYQKDTTSAAVINLTVQLRESYVSEAALGTLIGESILTDITNGYVTGTLSINGALIGNYSELYFRAIANQA